MPRSYKRKLGARPYKNYTNEHLEEAVNLIKRKKLSLRQASQRYNIPKNTLWLRTKRLATNMPGGQPVFTQEEERMFVGHTIAMSTYGFPVTTFDLRCVVKSYLDRTGRRVKCFTNNLPGRDWGNAFMKRHCAVLSQRTSKNISYARAANDEEVIKMFFENLECELDGIPPQNIWNFDETNLVDDPGSTKVITRRGTKYPEQIRNASKACTSIMVCGNAVGEVAPLYINYKADKLWTTWTENGPHGARYNRTKSGWFDQQSFEDWFVSLMLPILKQQEGIKAIIGDNLSSHINLEVLRLCEANNIKFIALPPNSTHLLQPLDVAFFRPMKSHWRKVLSEWKESVAGSRCTSIPKDQFPMLLKKLMAALETGTAQNLRAGFQKTGIHPLDKSQVLRKLPSAILQNDLAGISDIIGDTFIQHLQTKREETTSKRTIKRRKKLNVPPGKSIGSADLNDTAAVSNLMITDAPSTSGQRSKKQYKSIQPTRKSTREVVEPDDEDESDSSVAFSLHDSDSSLNLSEDEESNLDFPPENPSAVDTGVNLLAGKYVIVNFEGELYPGQIINVKNERYMISAMAKSGMYWKWPQKCDEIEYSVEEIVKHISEPKKVGSRGLYKVKELM